MKYEGIWGFLTIIIKFIMNKFESCVQKNLKARLFIHHNVV